MGERAALVGKGTPDPIDRAGRPPALLAFHGFTATPRELDPIAEVASELGLRVVAPLLPGHGTTPRDLSHARYDDWYRHGERELLRLFDETQRPLVAGGLSTGALIAMELAARHPDRILGLVVLANALTLAAPYPAWPLWLLSHMRILDLSVPKSSGPDIRDPEARGLHSSYRDQPLRAAAEVQRAGRRVRNLLGRIRCPVFVAHGREDHVCPVSNAWIVADRVGTSDVEVMILQRSWHIVTRDFDKDALCQRVRAFLERVARQMPVEP